FWTMDPAPTEVTSSSRAPTISPDLRIGVTSWMRAGRGCPPRGAVSGTLKHTQRARPAPVWREGEVGGRSGGAGLVAGGGRGPVGRHDALSVIPVAGSGRPRGE